MLIYLWAGEIIKSTSKTPYQILDPISEKILKVNNYAKRR
jgi:hypothetical protein